MKKTNFDRYLEEQLKDPSFAARYAQAGEAWDVALQLTVLRQQAGLSQKELAQRLNTSQQHISRLESPGYEGHSLAKGCRRVARARASNFRTCGRNREAEEQAGGSFSRYRSSQA
jgi:ribosome-binding protein aMBF1 (putative translation factor)